MGADPVTVGRNLQYRCGNTSRLSRFSWRLQGTNSSVKLSPYRACSRKTEKHWIGKRVAGEINISCDAFGYKPECDFCMRGLKTHCARRKVLGIVGHDGAFAEYLTLPLENLHFVPANVSDEKAVFIEPLAAACQILDQLNIRQFPSAAVLGDGKLAQLIALVLQAAGLQDYALR